MHICTPWCCFIVIGDSKKAPSFTTQPNNAIAASLNAMESKNMIDCE